MGDGHSSAGCEDTSSYSEEQYKCRCIVMCTHCGGENKDTHAMVPIGIIVAINAGRSTVQEDDLSNRQRNDSKLLELIKFLEIGTLPADEK